jgi:hypothetical protein
VEGEIYSKRIKEIKRNTKELDSIKDGHFQKNASLCPCCLMWRLQIDDIMNFFP